MHLLAVKHLPLCCNYQLVGSAMYILRLQYNLSNVTKYIRTCESTIREVTALQLIL